MSNEIEYYLVTFTDGVEIKLYGSGSLAGATAHLKRTAYATKQVKTIEAVSR